MKKSKKLPFKEGTWFAMPLRQGGNALGRVARLSPKGEIILAYYFGPKWEIVPTLDDIDQFTPRSAIKIVMVGALGMIDGSWAIVGDSPTWERDKWPIPPFVRRDEISKLAWRVIYSDDNPNQVISEQRIPYDNAEYETDGLYAAGAAEILLTQILL
jgi:hypothetical protein